MKDDHPHHRERVQRRLHDHLVAEMIVLLNQGCPEDTIKWAADGIYPGNCLLDAQRERSKRLREKEQAS